MARPKHDQTLAAEATEAARGPGPLSLPFARPLEEGGEGGVICAALPPPEGATVVPFAVDTVLWRKEMSLFLSVVVKMSFSALASPMKPSESPPRFQSRDVHHRNQSMSHVIDASDRVPWKTNIDVTALGHASAPQGRQVPELYARFALLSEHAVVIDKKVRVVGKRASPDAAPQPFSRMPVVYARAFGGPATPANPIGTGDDPDDEPPNILDLSNPWRPAGFGPISVVWPVRHRLLRDVPRRLLDGPVMELPRGFDWNYFQSAPPDQQIPGLPAGSLFVLESFDPERPRVELSLPQASVVGAVYGLDAEQPDSPSELGFRLDTIHFDADAWTCTLAYRAYIDVPDESMFPHLLVAAGVGLDGKDPVVPAERPALDKAAKPLPGPAPAPAAAPPTGTLDISAATPPVSLPFGKPPRAIAKAPSMDPEATLPVPAGDAAPLPDFIAPAARPTPPSARPTPPSARPTPPSAPPLTPPPATPLSPSAPPLTPPLRPTLPSPDIPAAYTADVPRPADLRGDPLPAAKPKRAPEEEVDLQRYGRLSAALGERGAKLQALLLAEGIETPVWRTAEKHWRRALDDEMKRGARGLRESYDDAYVAAWEKAHPERFGVAQYARLAHAEERGLLSVELSDQQLEPALGMRLRRVWRRRIGASAALKEQWEAALSLLRAEAAP